MLLVLALVVVPLISVAVKQFGRYLRELSHTTQAAAAVAASIAEVFNYAFFTQCLSMFVFSVHYFKLIRSIFTI